MARNDDHRKTERERRQPLLRLKAVHLGHADVDQTPDRQGRSGGREVQCRAEAFDCISTSHSSLPLPIQQYQQSGFLTSITFASRGSGATVKPSSRHICSIGSFSRKTSPASSPMPRCPAMSIRRFISKYPSPRPFQSLRTAMAYSARKLSGSAKKCTTPTDTLACSATSASSRS